MSLLETTCRNLLPKYNKLHKMPVFVVYKMFE